MKFTKTLSFFLYAFLCLNFSALSSYEVIVEHFKMPPDVREGVRLNENVDVFYATHEEDMKLPGAGLSKNMLFDISYGNDPLEGGNRVIHYGNGYIVDYALEPVHTVWTSIFPMHFRKGFSRMARNLNMPTKFISSMFQKKFSKSGIILSRFMVNTTVGLAGFYDPADEWYELESFETNFGRTFQVWGVGRGAYVVLPVQGSSSVRDSAGIVADLATDPITYIPFFPISMAVRAFFRINEMTLNLPAIRKVYHSNYDSYRFTKHIWFFQEMNEPKGERDYDTLQVR